MSNNRASDVVKVLNESRLMLATAESCTGGGIASLITDIPGSSAVYWGGVVSYANEAKTEMLGVDPKLIIEAGAVSSGVAQAMAWGIRNRSGADWTCAVTGIAGPGGGSEEKPVGTVWIAWCDPEGRPDAQLFHFEGDRAGIRSAAADEALNGLLKRMLKDSGDSTLDR